MVSPKLSPELSHELAALAQRLDYYDRNQLLAALDDIAAAAGSQTVTSLDSEIVPERAGAFIRSLLAREKVTREETTE